METPPACKLFVYDLVPSLFTSGFSSKFCVCAVVYDMESWPPAEGLEFVSCNAVLLSGQEWVLAFSAYHLVLIFAGFLPL